MSVRMRHTKGHTGNTRSHHGLKAPRLSTCGNCNGTHLRHHTCPVCGQYKGRKVIDVLSKADKKVKTSSKKEKVEEEKEVVVKK